MLLRGQGGVDKDEQKGLSYLKRAADQGHQGAVSALGWHYLLKREYDFAFKYLDMAARQGTYNVMPIKNWPKSKFPSMIKNFAANCFFKNKKLNLKKKRMKILSYQN